MKLSTTKLNFKGKPPVVFAFFGKQGSGKDTSAQYLAEAVQEEMNRGHDRLYRFKGKGFVNEMRLNDESNPTGIIISFAGALKEEVYSLYDKIRIQSNLDYSTDDWGKILMDEYLNTFNTLQENMHILEGVAQLLLKKETITGDEVRRIIKGETFEEILEKTYKELEK